jgi:hypothetical protein
MTIGIYNPNSRMKTYGKVGPLDTLPAQPLPVISYIHILHIAIKGTENLRAYKFTIGNLPEARLHAVRIGTMRAELRQLKAGM